MDARPGVAAGALNCAGACAKPTVLYPGRGSAVAGARHERTRLYKTPVLRNTGVLRPVYRAPERQPVTAGVAARIGRAGALVAIVAGASLRGWVGGHARSTRATNPGKTLMSLGVVLWKSC